jgi:hypothetical protein
MTKAQLMATSPLGKKGGANALKKCSPYDAERAVDQVAEDASWEHGDKTTRAKLNRMAGKAEAVEEKLRRKEEARSLEEAENEINSKIKGANKGSLMVTRPRDDPRRALMATIAKPAPFKINDGATCGQDDVGDVLCKPTVATTPREAATAEPTESVHVLADPEPAGCCLTPSQSMNMSLDKLRGGSGARFDSQHPRNQFARKPRTSAPTQIRAMPDDPSWSIVDWSGSGTVGISTAILRQSSSRSHLSPHVNVEDPVPLSTLKQLTQQSTAKFLLQKPRHLMHQSVVKRSRSSSTRPGKMLQGRCR